MNYDKNSFLSGLAVGRQMRGWGAGGGGTLPTLHAPAIALRPITGVSTVIWLTVTEPAANGDFTDGYRVYADGALLTTVQTTDVDLTALLGAGEHTITVRAYGAHFSDSAASNSAIYMPKYAAAPVLTSDAAGNVYITNGNTEAAYYHIYVDGTQSGLDDSVDAGATKDIRISQYISAPGVYTLTARFFRDDRTPSDLSAPLTYTVSGGNVTFEVYNGDKDWYGKAYFKFDAAPVSENDYDFHVSGGYDGAQPDVFGSIVPGGYADRVEDGTQYAGSAQTLYCWGNGNAYVSIGGSSVSLGTWQNPTVISAGGSITVTVTADSFDD